MAITLTEKAVKQISRYLTKRGHGAGVRLGVKTTGCSGMAYTLEYVDEIGPQDQVFESLGVKVMVDPKSFAYLDGTELDFAREGLNEGFKFNNPKERDRCGCGESFRV
jgi:iron-sulfur cluster assembly protein